MFIDKGCSIVIVTLGAMGAVYGSSQSQDCVHVAAEKVTAVDTTVCLAHLRSPLVFIYSLGYVPLGFRKTL